MGPLYIYNIICGGGAWNSYVYVKCRPINGNIYFRNMSIEIISQVCLCFDLPWVRTSGLCVYKTNTRRVGSDGFGLSWWKHWLSLIRHVWIYRHLSRILFDVVLLIAVKIVLVIASRIDYIATRAISKVLWPSQQYCLTGTINDFNDAYRKTSSISRTKSQSLNVPCILAQLSSLNPLKPGVKLRMKM